MDKSASSPTNTDQHAIEEAREQGITAWVAEQLGGKVIAITRLERWRPQWKVSYAVGDNTHTVLFRGDRPIAGNNDLRFEMDVMVVLEANGIKVPHIFGWCDAPKAFVMDWIDTEDRAPGMLHTAINNPSVMSEDRWQAMLRYMEHLAQTHAIPIEEFAHIRRLAQPPTTPTELALNATERMYQVGKQAGNNEITFDFLQRWLRRNIPQHRNRASFITGDAGQFMSAGTEVLALLDFEIANIGDTHWDLAGMRGRHPYENMGDIPALYRHYETVSGFEVDLRVIGYYTVAFLQLSAIGAKFFMNPEARGGNWIEGVLEYASITRRAYEAIAELQGITLDTALHLPEPDIQPWEDSGLNKLMVDIQRLPTSSVFEPWERELLHDIPRFLLNNARYRSWFEKETMADIAQLTARSFDDLSSADDALQALIAEDDAAMDEALVSILHKRMLRFSMIIAGTDPDDNNPLFHQLDPIM